MASADLPYDWVDERVRQAAPPGRSSQRFYLELLLLVIAIFALAYVLYEAQFSGTVRWALGSVIIAAVAAYAWFAVARKSFEPVPLAVPAPPAGFQTGELASLTAAARRANGGLVYSQVSVSTRARDAFAHKIALARGLSAEDLRWLQADPAALKRLFHDPVLEDFLFLATWEQAERYRWVLEAQGGAGFEATLRRALDHMEAWR